MRTRFALPVVLLAASGVSAAARLPPAGSYAFNWLDPDSSCRKLDEADLAKMSECTVNDNAFGLELKAHACRVSAQVELMVYASEAQCQQALETMQANGD